MRASGWAASLPATDRQKRAFCIIQGSTKGVDAVKTPPGASGFTISSHSRPRSPNGVQGRRLPASLHPAQIVTSTPRGNPQLKQVTEATEPRNENTERLLGKRGLLRIISPGG